MIKNAMFYQLSKNVEFDVDKLNEITETPLGQLERQRLSWTEWEESGSAVLEVMGFKFLRARLQERLLPASILNDFLATEIQKIEQDEDRKVGRREKAEIKSKVEENLLPKAFIKTSFTTLIINEKLNTLIVGVSSGAKADDAVSLLRSSCTSLPAVPFSKKFDSIRQTMTAWLISPEDRPEFVGVGDKFWFDSNSIAKSKFSASGVDNDSPALEGILEQGLEVSAIRVSFDGIGEFKIDKDIAISGFKPAETVIEEESSEEDVNASRILEADTFQKIATALSKCFQEKSGDEDQADEQLHIETAA